MITGDDFYRFKKLTVALTTRCNLRCKMCPAIRSEPATLTKDQALHIAEFARRRGFEEIELGGGEPTILPYFWDLLDELSQSDMAIKILTNGYRLSDDRIRRLAEYPQILVQVSIDGVGAVHDQIRGVDGAFEATERTLRKLAEAGCPISINSVFQHTNFRAMMELYERFKDLPLRWHAFNPVEIYSGHEESLRPEEVDQCLAALAEVWERAQEDGSPVSLSEELLTNFCLMLKYPLFKMHPGKGCAVVRRGVTVNHDGYVTPCWHYGWETSAIRRNLNQRPLDAIVDAPEVREEIRRAIGPRGCAGCSTMCYNWDEGFQNKVMRPTGRLKLRRAPFLAREHLKRRHPHAFAAAKAVRRLLHVYR